MNLALAYVDQNRDKFLADLREILTIPSISTDPERKADMQRAAEWISLQLRGLGMAKVQVMPTAGHPVVFGEWLGAGTSAPTVLIYGHYDVQPPDPLELWSSPPFEPEVRGDYLYARGAADMKGQVLACLKAVEAIVRTGALPVNIKWLIEGEEEIGSENLDLFIQEHKDLLACDFCLNADAGMLAAGEPSITTGLRGLAYYELRVHGPAKDLHSGMYGGIVHNPAQVLSELIAGMHDAKGKVMLPGFYDKVRRLSPGERRDFARLPVRDRMYREQAGVSALWGEPGFTPAERVGARPTLEVNGLLSGFTGVGSKTVLPAWAMAKISCRLVPDQTEAGTTRQLRAYLKQRAPRDIRWELVYLHGAGAALTSTGNPGVQAMRLAMKEVWGKEPHFLREGGSIGVVVQLQRHLKVDSILCGFALPDSDMHSPNEKQNLPTWFRGIETMVRFVHHLA